MVMKSSMKLENLCERLFKVYAFSKIKKQGLSLQVLFFYGKFVTPIQTLLLYSEGVIFVLDLNNLVKDCGCSKPSI